MSREYVCSTREAEHFPTWEDDVWKGLPSMQLLETVSETPPTLPTTVEAFRTEKALYFRFTCVDDFVKATMTRRDDPIYDEDVVEVFLSESGSVTEYKEFELSPANVQFDAQIRYVEGKRDLRVEWDAPGWRTEVVRLGSDLDWGCVWELPWETFSTGAPSSGDVWLMNCYRIDRSHDGSGQLMAWSPTGVRNFHVPERFGRLRFS